MTTWFVSIGNSDIQLTSAGKKNWGGYSDDVFEELYRITYTPNKLEDQERWTVPARMLGIAYENHLGEVEEKLCFPLLDIFFQKLQELKVNPEQIICILSDQSALFEENERTSIKCPYWKDTCTLQPILEVYLQKHFPKAKLNYIPLQPTNKGLDNWDSTLTLIQAQLATINLNKTKDIYVSHQAGTPAISSALQFVTLAQFGSKVKFLVSNEYQETIEVIKSSKYLRGLQIQQAKSLVTTSPGAVKKLLQDKGIGDEEYLQKLTYWVNFSI